MENLINYIKPELLIVAVLLYGLGVVLKKSKLKDNFIPVILTIVGIIVGILYCGITEGFSFASISIGTIQGILCAASSTHVNQVIKQMKKLGQPNTEIVEALLEEGRNDS